MAVAVLKRDPGPSAPPREPKGRRCLNRDQAADYLAVSKSTIDRLIGLGKLPIVRLPVARRDGGGPGVTRSVLIDVQDLDRLIEASKETK